MTDRELLELAAKAAGLDIEWQPGDWAHDNETGCEWNPLTDDGDALRLAAALHIDIEWQAKNPFPEQKVEAYQRNDAGDYFCATEDQDNYRRAIVRAAAEIGKGVK